jgi:hypothetical protein
MLEHLCLPLEHMAERDVSSVVEKRDKPCEELSIIRNEYG